MDYTTNYHLPQWVESDRILMEDFNQAMAGIDTGIKAAQDTAEGRAGRRRRHKTLPIKPRKQQTKTVGSN